MHTELTDSERETLLRIAAIAIRDGLANRSRPTALADKYPAALRLNRAVFVTLTIDGALRGCIGTLDATQPLVDAVRDAAFSAAFEDPRFPPLTGSEWRDTVIAISVLSPRRALSVTSREALVASLRPGEDGLVIEDGAHRATFLPSVWEQLPDPQEFVSHLLIKAGLPADHWSANVRCYRYQTTSFDSSDICLPY